MNVFYESLQGPQKCKVIREIDATTVALKPIGYPRGVFGRVEPAPLNEFIASKRFCWASARALNRYGTRHEYVGRPDWEIRNS